MTAQWENECITIVYPLPGMGSIPSCCGIFQGIYPCLATLHKPVPSKVMLPFSKTMYSMANIIFYTTSSKTSLFVMSARNGRAILEVDLLL